MYYTVIKHDGSSGIRPFVTLLTLASDWSVDKWSVLIGRELTSRDKMERSDWLEFFFLGGWVKMPTYG